jgi:chitin deacetylase
MLKKLSADRFRAVTVGECLGDPIENWYRRDDQYKAPRKGKPLPAPENITADGKCGGKVSCIGSAFGVCCSGTGFCGNSTEFCGAGCQANAGYCESDFDGSQHIGPGIVGSDPLGDSITSGKKYVKSDATSTSRNVSLMFAFVFLFTSTLL